MLVIFFGPPVLAKRSPIAWRIASGQFKPEDELTQTVAPSGMHAATCSGEMTSYLRHVYIVSSSFHEAQSSTVPIIQSRIDTRITPISLARRLLFSQQGSSFSDDLGHPLRIHQQLQLMLMPCASEEFYQAQPV